MPDFPFVNLALTPQEFAAYVASYDFGKVPPDYTVLHHSAIPAASWAPSGPAANFWDAGEVGMSLAQIKAKRLRQLGSIKNYYQNDLGWSAGPHIFIDDLFIYLMTPMYNLGIHAMWGNSFTSGGKLHYSIGIEVIGDYTHVQWPAKIQANVRAAVQTLQKRLGTFTLDYLYSDPATKPGKIGSGDTARCPHPERLRFGGISSHRDYNKPSCPGNAITEEFYMSVLRADTTAPIADSLPTPLPYLGVGKNDQAISAGTFAAVLRDHNSPLAPFAMTLYDWLISLDIAADVWLGQCAKESSFCTTGISATACNPLNRKARGDEPKQGDFADYLGAPWLGALDSLCHVKWYYGQHGKTTLEDIIPGFAPPSENDVTQYIAFVRQTVAAIRRREV